MIIIREPAKGWGVSLGASNRECAYVQSGLCTGSPSSNPFYLIIWHHCQPPPLLSVHKRNEKRRVLENKAIWVILLMIFLDSVTFLLVLYCILLSFCTSKLINSLSEPLVNLTSPFQPRLGITGQNQTHHALVLQILHIHFAFFL